MEAVATLKRALPEVELIAGNVATKQGACDLISLGVDGIKVGIGPEINLHHTRGERRGRSADHRDRGVLSQATANPAACR